MLGVTRHLAQQLCFTRYLVERDCLSTAMTRMGNGFTPPTVISEAKMHLGNINRLMTEMEKMAVLPKDAIVARDYNHLMDKSCCGRD
jgi:hypothetical protein